VVSLARKLLLHDKTRFGIALTATTLSLLLIFTLTGLYQGFYRQSTAYIDSSGADLWVAQKGAPNFFYAISFLPMDMNDSIAHIGGVKAVSPLIAVGATAGKGGTNVSIFFFGYDTQTGLGGPSPIISGSSITGEGQIVVDSNLASTLGTSVGDEVSINGHGLRVVGISGVGGVLAPIGFTDLQDAERITGYASYVNYFLVRVSPGVSTEGVASALRGSVQGVSVFSNSEWASSSRDAVLAGSAPVIQAMEVFGGLTGVLIIGLMNYSATAERQREYGILKALGMKNRGLLSAVLWQSSAIAIVGFAVAGVLTSVVVRGLAYLVHYPIAPVYDVSSVALVLVEALLMSVFATFIPARRISRIDPALAFR
jgi:putative ABC transport system permease protein